METNLIKPKVTAEYLAQLNALTFMDEAIIRERFIILYLQTHEGATEDVAESFYSTESYFFKKIISASEDLKRSTIFSLYGCLMDIVINGLSFDPAARLIYTLSRSFNTAAKNAAPVWEKRAYNEVSPYGELALRILAKQIAHIDDPIVVYEGDQWEPGYNDQGNRYCKYRAILPHEEKKIIGSFLKVTRLDGSVDFPFFTEENINEWRAASEKQNGSGKGNLLYGTSTKGISIGFLKAKTIKHAFKTYPKVKVIGSCTTISEGDEYPLPIAELPETPKPIASEIKRDPAEYRPRPLINDDFLEAPAKSNDNFRRFDDDNF